MKKIAIIGGGASGLVAAIAAARTNPQAQILIYEKKDSAGKKILATGNGRCNLTNKDMNASYFHSDNLSVVEEVLQKFGYEDTIAFFTSLGLLTKARGNYVYPYSDQASTVLDLLKSELDRLHVKITTDVTVTGISPTSHGFTVLTDHQKQKADAVILGLRRESEFQARIRRKWLCTCKAARTYDGSGRTCSGSIKSKESSVCQSRRGPYGCCRNCSMPWTTGSFRSRRITAYGLRHFRNTGFPNQPLYCQISVFKTGCKSEH